MVCGLIQYFSHPLKRVSDMAETGIKWRFRVEHCLFLLRYAEARGHRVCQANEGKSKALFHGTLHLVY